MRELILRKCESCGAIVKVIKDCHCKCGFMCCGDQMEIVEANSVDAAFENDIEDVKANVTPEEAEQAEANAAAAIADAETVDDPQEEA